MFKKLFKKLSKNLNNKKGFNIIELLVIIAIAVSIAYGAGTNLSNAASDKVTDVIGNIETAGTNP